MLPLSRGRQGRSLAATASLVCVCLSLSFSTYLSIYLSIHTSLPSRGTAVSYKRLKRILGKIEVQQNKAKRAAERERERLALDEERQTAQVLTNGASSINAAAGLAHGRDANASPMSMDATPVGSLPQPLTLTRQVAASKYTSPLLRSYGSSERSATPPPPQQAPAGYSVLIDGGDRAGVPFSGASRSSSPVPAFASSSTSVPAGIWSTPPLGQAYAYNTGDGSSQFSTPSLAGVGAGDARPEFFQVIEDDIRRINKFYRERVQALLAEVQGFQVRQSLPCPAYLLVVDPRLSPCLGFS